MQTIAGVLLLLPSTFARQIVFPSPLDLDHSQEVLKYSDLDVSSGSRFAGLTTFANLPYTHCLAKDSTATEPFDIAILGAPFDTAVTARPGARFGPTGIRSGSRRIGALGAWDVYTGKNPFVSWAKIVDCGDAPLTFLDNTVALAQLEKAHDIVSTRKTNAINKSSVPRTITLGGDHTTTLAALRSTFKQWGPVSVIHFDSHIDTWNPKVLGGDISHYAGVNHGTFLHIAHEEGLILNSSIHVGIRAPIVRPQGDIRNDLRCGFEIITARDLDLLGVQGIIKAIKARIGSNRVYLSLDIDVLDPAFAPGTGTAEVGGWTTRELLTILDGLEGLNLIGADVVEVSPIYDNAGEATTLAASQAIRSLLSLMVDQPVKA
ncbi:MAG: hypothetical protein M1814_002728 [Vezdaea aestivalis]|nr:MAG: hypothetical protein M1814_002728 [Vezdaea aestivalis]